MGKLKTLNDRMLNAFYSTTRIMFINFYRTFVVRIRVFNSRKIPQDRSLIFAINHTTGADPIIVLGALREKIYWLAGAERFKNKFSAFFMRNFTNSVPVFRKEFLRNFNSFKELFSISKGKKVFFGVFPEGKLNKTGVIERIQKGAAYLSYKTKIPIVPVYIHNIHKGVNIDSRIGKKPVWEGIFSLFFNAFRRINVIIGDPIDPMAENIMKELEETGSENANRIPVDNINQALYDEFIGLQLEADNLIKIKKASKTENQQKKKIRKSSRQDYDFEDEDLLIDSLDDEDFAENTGNAK